MIVVNSVSMASSIHSSSACEPLQRKTPLNRTAKPPMRAARLFGFGFPYGTLTVNVVGSVIMGLLTEFKNCASS